MVPLHLRVWGFLLNLFTMKGLRRLLDVLEASIAKHGEKPLTNVWLKNLIALAIKLKEMEEKDFDEFLDGELFQIFHGDAGDRDV